MTATMNQAAVVSLYRRLLKAHARHLPSAEMQQLGNTYVKAEFRLHRQTAKPEQMATFLKEWNKYLQQLEMTARAAEAISPASSTIRYGTNLPDDLALTQEQHEQLEKLRLEALKLHDNPIVEKHSTSGQNIK
jgi:Complex1_LYR-like